MDINENLDHSLPLDTAIEYCANYRDANPGTPTNPTIKAHFYGKAALLEMLNQTDCIGMRVYYALTEDGKKQFVLTGVNADNNDLYNGKLLDRSVVCPPDCGGYSPLQG